MRPPILIVLHGELSTPGRVAIQLRNRGIPLDVRRPRFGDDLPRTLKEHSGAVIFGGPQSANDDDEIVKREIDWIGVALKEKKPYLGICLGAQMLAKHLGARVYKHADGHAEVGYYPIRPTAAGRTVCKDWPDHVYQWHREGFDLPGRPVHRAKDHHQRLRKRGGGVFGPGRELAPATPGRLTTDRRRFSRRKHAGHREAAQDGNPEHRRHQVIERQNR